MKLQLLSSPNCHLCLIAKQMLLANQLEFEELDIQQHSIEKEQYALKIPVLRLQHSQAELCWPFDEQSLKNWLHCNA